MKKTKEDNRARIWILPDDNCLPDELKDAKVIMLKDLIKKVKELKK